ncbi:hypothetical protein ASC87_21280 [Rhizobacter sp. Root1221]|nr:hypothetical protein ASC87_21280 [Rhizobacter sp. Root1221]
MTQDFKAQQARQMLRRRTQHANELARAQQADNAANGAQQGKFGDYVFKAIQRPNASPLNRTTQLPGQRPAGSADANEKEVPEEPGGEAESAKDKNNPNGPNVAAVDPDRERRRQPEHRGDADGGSHGGSGQQSGSGTGGGSGDNAGNGGGSGTGSGHGGGGSGSSGGGSPGGGGSGSSGGGRGDGGSGNRQAPAGMLRSPSGPLAMRSASATLSSVKPLLKLVVEAGTPQDRQQALAHALAVLNSYRTEPGEPSVEALQLEIMAVYLEATQNPEVPITRAEVKEILTRQDSISSTEQRSDPKLRNRNALMPLKLLISDLPRTDAQRAMAVDRMRGGHHWLGPTPGNTP